MTDPTPDPFRALRAPVVPLAPRPGFTAELRSRLDAALRPTPIRQEPTMTDTTAPTAAPTAPAPTLTPYLVVAGGATAIDWYRDVLGAIETLRFADPDGRIGHAELTIGAAKVMLADEFPDLDLLAPTTRGGTTVTLHLEVVDVDYSYRRAVDAGAAGQRPPADQGHGSRNATLVDPFGHRWMLSQPISADRAAAGGEGESEGEGEGDEGVTWTTTGRRPVEPGYLTLQTKDLARATAFYGQLFDWHVVAGHLADGGHVENTHFPMGLFQVGPDREPGTTVYFRVDDVEAYAARVEALGGRVLSRSDWESGGNVECEDDQGRRFDLFRPAPGY